MATIEPELGFLLKVCHAALAAAPVQGPVIEPSAPPRTIPIEEARRRLADEHRAVVRREVAYQLLNAIDAAQTIHFVSKGDYRELNPLLGHKPSAERVMITKISAGVLHWVITDALERRASPETVRQWQVWSIVIQGGVVAANMRAVF